MKKPNILLIITDQQRADHVGFAGNDIINTPNLDKLAERSMVFDKAYVANPICMPNRCSIMTGRVPSAHGVIFNDRSLAWTANTFVRQFEKTGYRTGLIGKSHIQHGMSRDALRPLKKDPFMADPFPEYWNEKEHCEHYRNSAEPVTDFYGFQHAEFCLGHGDLIEGHHYRWAIEKGANPEDLRPGTPYDHPALQQSDNWWQIYQPVIGEEYYSTTFVAERSIEWLAGQNEDEPWLLQCSFPDPHHPFTPPGQWWGRHDAADMILPASFTDPLTNAPAHLKLFQSFEPRENFVQMFGATEAIVKESLAAEYGMIEMIDDAIGQVLAKLEQKNMLDNTVILFTSDHGDMFGEHGLMLKGMMHYQGCLRVPMTIAGPGIRPGRSSSLVSSLDIPQTLLDLAALPEFDHMQGSSFVPVIEDPATSIRDHVYIEEDLPLFESTRIPHKVRTLVTQDARISTYSTGETEIFNLVDDPAEMNNLAVTDPSSETAINLKDRLTNALIQYSDLARLNAR